MDEYKIQKSTLDDIADAINAKTGKRGQMSPGEMVEKIESITPAKQEQSKTLTLGAAAPVTVLPDSGKVLSSVSVVLDTSVIKAENIAKNVQMLGVTGTHGGGGEMDEDIEFAQFISTEPIVANYSEVSLLRPGAFQFSPTLTIASFPVCTSIGAEAFCNCSKLTTVSFPVCTTISNSAFTYCSALIAASFPACTMISGFAFSNCKSLTAASFPVCTTIGAHAFEYCSALTTTSFPVCTSIGTYAFDSCSALTTISFPVCTSIDAEAFWRCSALTTISFPVCTRIGSSAFYTCINLTTISFPACTAINTWAFEYCYNLRSLYLTGSQYVNLAASNAFSSTPIGGYTTSTGGVYGSIYVPASMLESYKTRTNWSFFSSRFVEV